MEILTKKTAGRNFIGIEDGKDRQAMLIESPTANTRIMLGNQTASKWLASFAETPVSVEKKGVSFEKQGVFTIGRTRLRRRSEHEKDIIKLVSHNITGEIPINRITLYRVGENGSHAETLNCLEHSAYRANRGANTGHGFC
jgi:hypothetical protein